MPNRRDVLAGCLLAGISLSLGVPVVARAGGVQWSASWTVRESKGGGLLVSLTVSPSQATELSILNGAGGGQSAVSGPLTAQVNGAARSVEVGSDQPIYARSSARRRMVKVASGGEVKLGPWLVDAQPGEDVTLSVVLDGQESVTLTHLTGEPRFAVTWDARLAQPGEATVFVSLTPDRDVVLRLYKNRLQSFRVQAGGELLADTAPVSRAGPRPEMVPIAAGDTRRLGGWRVRTTASVLTLAATVLHDRGQAALSAEVPVKAADA